MPSLQGKLLIAASPLRDPNFTQSVSLLVRHDQQGAMGLVLNRATPVPLAEAWARVSNEPCGSEAALYQGGPCEGPVMVLHGDADRADQEVIAGVYFTVEPERVGALVAEPPGRSRFFAGYAGWVPGQLEAEMATGSWLVADATVEAVFTHDPQVWRRLVWMHDPTSPLSKIDPKHIPQDPSMN